VQKFPFSFGKADRLYKKDREARDLCFRCGCVYVEHIRKVIKKYADPKYDNPQAISQTEPNETVYDSDEELEKERRLEEHVR